MDFKKNKTLITVVVLFVAFGLVLAYVPLLFAPSPSPIPEPPAAASLTPPAVETETATPTPTSTSVEEEPPLPDSFSGLEEESESLDGILEGY